MKRKVLPLILPLTLCFVSCSSSNSSSNSSSKNTNHVTYYLNVNSSETIYKSYDLALDDILLEPEEPNVKDYVFEGWYLDAEGQNKFYGFNNKLYEDVNLYASWSKYEDAPDEEKISRFMDKLKSYEGNVSEAVTKATGFIYYGVVQQQFGISEIDKFHRYKDIMTVDKYDDQDVLFEQQQYLYNDKNFYSLTKDIEGEGANDAKNYSKFNENKIETFLNIGFTQTYFTCLRNILSQVEDGFTHDEIEYDLKFNYTEFSSRDKYYSFSYGLYTFDQTDQANVEEIYNYEIGVSFVNKKIQRATVTEQYIYALDAEVYLQSEITSETEYVTTDEYEVFEGTRFNPDDFPYVNS